MERKKTVLSVVTFLIVILLLFVVTVKLSAQNNKLEGSVKSLHLVKGNYQLVGKLYVSDSLVVEPGVTIKFEDNTNITISGFASFKGNSSDKINLIGVDSLFAEGIVIKGQSETKLLFDHVHFEKLITPINLSNDWYRPFVDIQHCEFVKNTTSNTTLLNVLNPFVPADLNIKTAKITISENVFAHNLSPIYFEDFHSAGLNISLINNTFSENYIRGNGFYSYYANVLYGRLDKSIAEGKAIIENNAFVNNYLYDLDSDTLVQASNMGIYGSSDSLIIANNYLDELSGVYDNRLNYDSPRIINNIRDLNLNSNPPFIKNIYNENQSLIKSDFTVAAGLRSLILESNREINFDQLKVVFHYKPASDKVAMVDSTLKVIGSMVDKTKFKVVFNQDSLFKQNLGYISFTQLKGLQNEYVPETMVGYGIFLKKTHKRRETFLKQTNSDTLKKPSKLVQEIKIKRRFEVGLLTGYAVYHGTISSSSILKNDLNTSFGLQFKYIINRKYSASISVQSFTLTGSDLNSSDTFKLKRGMSFKSPVLSAGIQLFRDFGNNRTYHKNKIIPSLGVGLEYIKFNPMGQFLGKWYDLQTLGTGGQNLPGAKNSPYPLTTLGSVISGELNFFKSKSIVIGANFSYHFTYTNYLDDVGPDIYPSISAIEKAGGTDAAPSIYFSNPSGLLHGAKQLRSGSYDGFDNYASFHIRIAKVF
jgi:hypothetical protein